MPVTWDFRHQLGQSQMPSDLQRVDSEQSEEGIPPRQSGAAQLLARQCSQRRDMCLGISQTAKAVHLQMGGDSGPHKGLHVAVASIAWCHTQNSRE